MKRVSAGPLDVDLRVTKRAWRRLVPASAAWAAKAAPHPDAAERLPGGKESVLLGVGGEEVAAPAWAVGAAGDAHVAEGGWSCCGSPRARRCRAAPPGRRRPRAAAAHVGPTVPDGPALARRPTSRMLVRMSSTTSAWTPRPSRRRPGAAAGPAGPRWRPPRALLRSTRPPPGGRQASGRGQGAEAAAGRLTRCRPMRPSGGRRPWRRCRRRSAAPHTRPGRSTSRPRPAAAWPGRGWR